MATNISRTTIDTDSMNDIDLVRNYSHVSDEISKRGIVVDAFIKRNKDLLDDNVQEPSIKKPKVDFVKPLEVPEKRIHGGGGESSIPVYIKRVEFPGIEKQGYGFMAVKTSSETHLSNLLSLVRENCNCVSGIVCFGPREHTGNLFTRFVVVLCRNCIKRFSDTEATRDNVRYILSHFHSK
jgi:hypothetical protein